MASNLVTSDNARLYELQDHSLMIKKAPEETGLARRKKKRDYNNPDGIIKALATR